MADTCQNPFFACASTEPTKIAVDILYKGQRLSLCQDCWQKLADTDITWASTTEDENLKAKDLRRWK